MVLGACGRWALPGETDTAPRVTWWRWNAACLPSGDLAPPVPLARLPDLFVGVIFVVIRDSLHSHRATGKGAASAATRARVLCARAGQVSASRAAWASPHAKRLLWAQSCGWQSWLGMGKGLPQDPDSTHRPGKLPVTTLSHMLVPDTSLRPRFLKHLGSFHISCRAPDPLDLSGMGTGLFRTRQVIAVQAEAEKPQPPAARASTVLHLLSLGLGAWPSPSAPPGPAGPSSPKREPCPPS